MKIITNKFTKIVALTLMVVILLSVTMPMAAAWQAPTSVPFTDTRNHWAAHNIGWAYANNITSGTSPTTFHPNRDVSRAEFVTFLHRVAGRPSVGGTNPFNDVRQGTWYSTPVTWAYTNNITSGTSATTFHPSRPITRQELATMLHRYIQNIRTDVVRADANVINGFHDAGQVSSWAIDSVGWAIHNDIIGRGGSINPLGNASRAETVTMLRRFVNIFNLPTTPRPAQSQIRDILGVDYTIDLWEHRKELYAPMQGETVRWIHLTLSQPLNMSRFPSTGQHPLGIFGNLFSFTELGDVLIVIYPDGRQFLYIDIGISSHNPGFQISWYHVVPININLNDPTREQMRGLMERASVLNDRNLFGGDLIAWNRFALGLLPSYDWFLQYALLPQRGFQSDHPEIIAKAQSITRGLDNDMDKARAIHNWVARNIRAEWDGGSTMYGAVPVYSQEALTVLRERVATCVGYASLTISLMRAVNIPAVTIGSDLLNSNGSVLESHLFYSAFIDGRWVVGDSVNLEWFDLSINELTSIHGAGRMQRAYPMPGILIPWW